MSSPRHQLRMLGERLAKEQDVLLAKNPARATLRLPGRGKPKRVRLVLAAAALSVPLVVLVALVMPRTRPLELTVGGEPALRRWITAPRDLTVPVRFSDGSEVTLHPESRARVLDVTGSGAHLMLESGTAQVSVKPNRNGHWTFSAGPFTVEVRGTRFEIAWSPQDELFKLTLIEGKVIVSGCALGDARSLFAGETLLASCRTNDFRIARTALHDAPESAPARSPPNAQESFEAPPLASNDATMTTAPAPASAQAGAPVETWQALARASKFKDAFARANDKGFEAELRRADVEDLLLLGDVSRLSGNSSHAMRAYQALRGRAPGTESAANAAFSIGRVYFDQRDAYGDSARWFATYLNERGDGPLAREALGRQMEALSRAGDHAGAARAAEQYLQQYPKGPHAPLAKTLRTDDN